jgi:hypothetical protein
LTVSVKDVLAVIELELPPVPVMVTVYTPALPLTAADGKVPPLPQPETAARPPNSTSNAASDRTARRRRNGIKQNKQANTAPPAARPWLFSAWTDVAATVEIVATAVAFPPATSVTLTGASAHVGGLAALLPLTEHASATVPAKPLVEATEMLLVAGTPEVAETELGFAAKVNPGEAGAATETAIADAVTTAVPLVPVTTTSRTPEVPATVFIVSTSFAAEPAVKPTDTGATEQLPAAVPLAVLTAHVSATAPAKLLTEATVIESVPPAPATSERLDAAGVTVKLDGAVTTTESTAEVEAVKLLSPE